MFMPLREADEARVGMAAGDDGTERVGRLGLAMPAPMEDALTGLPVSVAAPPGAADEACDAGELT